MKAAVQVEGWREVRKALRMVDKKAPNDLRKEIKQAMNPVINDAKSKAAEQKMGRAATQSIRGFADAKGGGVKAGNERTKGRSAVPYWAFMDFGGRRKRDRQVWRPKMKRCRVLYPAILDRMDDIKRSVDNAISTTVHRWFDE